MFLQLMRYINYLLAYSLTARFWQIWKAVGYQLYHAN